MALDTIADLGARTVLITLDSGCYGLTREERPAQRFHATAPTVEPVSVAGAGDVLTAAFLASRLAERPFADSLRYAVAAASASTLEVGAGRFEPREAGRLSSQVEVAELEPVET